MDADTTTTSLQSRHHNQIGVDLLQTKLSRRREYAKTYLVFSPKQYLRLAIGAILNLPFLDEDPLSSRWQNGPVCEASWLLIPLFTPLLLLLLLLLRHEDII